MAHWHRHSHCGNGNSTAVTRSRSRDRVLVARSRSRLPRQSRRRHSRVTDEPAEPAATQNAMMCRRLRPGTAGAGPGTVGDGGGRDSSQGRPGRPRPPARRPRAGGQNVTVVKARRAGARHTSSDPGRSVDSETATRRHQKIAADPPVNAPIRRKMLIAVTINLQRVDLSAARRPVWATRAGCRAGRFRPVFALPCSPRKLKGMDARRRIPPGQDEFSRRIFLENSFFLENFRENRASAL